MKKDIFGGNIKREYYSYVLFTIVFGPLISIGVGALCTYGLFQIESGAFDTKWYFGIGLTAFFYLFGILYFLLSIFAIRKYPKYPKLRSMLLNSDSYFVGNNSKEYRGHWRGRAAFDAVTHIAEQNKGLENIKYPKKYKRYIILTIIGIVLMFAFIFITCKVTENIELLPKAFQNKYVIFGSFAVAEITDIVLSFIFAFKVRKIRKETKEKYEEMCWGWRYSLPSALIDISVRKTDTKAKDWKKHKFWYKNSQLKKIEALVSSASMNAELEIESREGEPVSFKILDRLDSQEVFKGYFI